MRDRDEVYESRNRRNAPIEAVGRDREAEAKHIVESAILLINTFEKYGFERDVSLMLCSQLLPKLL